MNEEMNIATQYDGTFDLQFLKDDEDVRCVDPLSRAVEVRTKHGPVRAEVGDWLIRTTDGRLVNRKFI